MNKNALPASYKLTTCIDKFMYMHSSIIICMHACICLAHNYTEALSHCGPGHDLTSVASVANIADIRSAFVETLASERFRRNAVDGTP